MVSLTSPQARSIAEKLLGRQPDRCDPFMPEVGGSDSVSFRLSVGRQHMLLNVKRRPGTPIGIYFHSRLKAAGIPVPDLIAFDTGAGPNGETCAIWEWIEGLPATWDASGRCPYDEAEFGALLRHIHDLRFEGAFGFLGDNPTQRTFSLPSLGPTSASWAGFFHCDEVAHDYLEQGYLDRGEARVLSSLPARLHDELNHAEPRLLHMGDIMHNGNMLVEPSSGRILAVLDYTESMAGDPRWELAWVRYYFADCPYDRPAFNLARFWDGYGACYGRDDPLGRFYLAAILLFEKLRFYDPASSRGRWAIDTVKSILHSFTSS